MHTRWLAQEHAEFHIHGRRPQQRILDVKRRGFLLALASKNNWEDVRQIRAKGEERCARKMTRLKHELASV